MVLSSLKHLKRSKPYNYENSILDQYSIFQILKFFIKL